MSAAPAARSVSAYAVARILREGVTLDVALAGALARRRSGQRSCRALAVLRRGARLFSARGILARLLSQPVGHARPPGARAALRGVVRDRGCAHAAIRGRRCGGAQREGDRCGARQRPHQCGAAPLSARAPRDRRRDRRQSGHPPCGTGVAGGPLRADWPVRWTQLLAAADTQAPMWLRVDSRRAIRPRYIQQLQAAGISARADARVPFAVVLEAPCDVHAAAGLCHGPGLGAGSRRAMRRVSAGARGGPARARCLRGAGRQDGADRRARSRTWTGWWPWIIDPKRLERVRENLARTGLAARLVCGDATDPAAWWDGCPFDRILLDAPCSALGVIRRHPDIRLRKSPSEIDKLPQLQAAAADRAVALPGSRAAAWSMRPAR